MESLQQLENSGRYRGDIRYTLARHASSDADKVVLALLYIKIRRRLNASHLKVCTPDQHERNNERLYPRRTERTLPKTSHPIDSESVHEHPNCQRHNNHIIQYPIGAAHPQAQALAGGTGGTSLTAATNSATADQYPCCTHVSSECPNIASASLNRSEERSAAYCASPSRTR